MCVWWGWGSRTRGMWGKGGKVVGVGARQKGRVVVAKGKGMNVVVRAGGMAARGKGRQAGTRVWGWAKGSGVKGKAKGRQAGKTGAKEVGVVPVPGGGMGQGVWGWGEVVGQVWCAGVKGKPQCPAQTQGMQPYTHLMCVCVGVG